MHHTVLTEALELAISLVRPGAIASDRPAGARVYDIGSTTPAVALASPGTGNHVSCPTTLPAPIEG